MSDAEIKFDPLPTIVSEIREKVDSILNLLENHPNFQIDPNDDILTIDQASEFTSLAKQTIYQLVSERRIPYSKRKGTKRLYFSRNELREWMLSGHRKVRN